MTETQPQRRSAMRMQNSNSTGRGQAPQNSKLAECCGVCRLDFTPPILSFAVPDPEQMLFPPWSMSLRRGISYAL